MSLILDKKLILGSKEDACNKKFIEENNINIIFNISNDIKNYFPDKAKYLNIKIEDSISENLLKIFDTYTDIINNELKMGNIVFIHCSRGKSRSASFIIAYLIKYNNMDLDTAYNFVKGKRDISPNIKFFKQLSDYEYNIYNKRTLQVWEYMNKTKEEYLEFIEIFH